MQELQEPYASLGIDLRTAAQAAIGAGTSTTTCAAFAIAAIAIRLAEDNQTDEKDEMCARVQNRTQKLRDAFQSAFGSTDCPKMTGHEMSTPEQYQAYLASGVRDKVCQDAVRLAVVLALEQR